MKFNVLFYKGDSLISKVIKRISNSKKYSHVAFILDQYHLLELDYKTPLSIKHLQYKHNQYDIYVINVDLTNEQKQDIIKFMIDRISTSYDWKFIISRGFNFLFGTKIFNSKHRYNCDELIVQAFKQVLDIDLVDGTKTLSPELLSKSKYLSKTDLQ